MPLGGPRTPGEPFSGPGRSQKDGWTSKEAGKGARRGHRGNRGDGLWAGPAAGKAARRPETSEKPRRRPEGGRADPRCPETGRTGPGRGENPRKSEAKRLNYTKTAVTSTRNQHCFVSYPGPPGPDPGNFPSSRAPPRDSRGRQASPPDHAGKAADRRTPRTPLCQDLQHRRPPAPGNPEGQPGDLTAGTNRGPPKRRTRPSPRCAR